MWRVEVQKSIVPTLELYGAAFSWVLANTIVSWRVSYFTIWILCYRIIQSSLLGEKRKCSTLARECRGRASQKSRTQTALTSALSRRRNILFSPLVQVICSARWCHGGNVTLKYRCCCCRNDEYYTLVPPYRFARNHHDGLLQYIYSKHDISFIQKDDANSWCTANNKRRPFMTFNDSLLVRRHGA